MKKSMAMLLAFVVLLAVTAAGVTSPAQAQAPTKLEYGALVKVPFTEAAAQAQFTFEGKKDDLVVVSVDDDYTASEYGVDIAIVITAADGTKLADTTEVFQVYARSIVRLSADGTYNIALSVKADSSTKAGSMQLRLTNPEVLEVGKSISGELTAKDVKEYESFVRYIEFRGDKPTTITYSVESDDFDLPDFLIYAMTPEDLGQRFTSNRAEADLESFVTSASFTITPKANMIYLIELSNRLVSAPLKFTLSAAAAQ